MTGGILFAVTLPKAPASVNAELITTDDIHANLSQLLKDEYQNRYQANTFEKLFDIIESCVEGHQQQEWIKYLKLGYLVL